METQYSNILKVKLFNFERKGSIWYSKQISGNLASAHVVANRGFLPAAVETKETQYGLMYTFMLTN